MNFGVKRAQFFAKTENGLLTGVERLIKYANDYQNTQTVRSHHYLAAR
jgi:DNA polymerase-3 subunit alpha